MPVTRGTHGDKAQSGRGQGSPPGQVGVGAVRNGEVRGRVGDTPGAAQLGPLAAQPPARTGPDADSLCLTSLQAR